MKEIKLNLKPDYEGCVEATLLHSKSTTIAVGAVLYVHGYIDYFFQNHVAEFFNSHGYDFYALDLRKYGRSYLPNQHFNYCRDLSEYFEEITRSINIITDNNALLNLTLLAHSTGGLIAALYASRGEARSRIKMLILNSPFFELNSTWIKRNVFVPIAACISTICPYAKKKNELSLHTQKQKRSMGFQHRLQTTRWSSSLFCMVKSHKKGSKRIETRVKYNYSGSSFNFR
ncbi:MAG: alpha/beta hydrolase [Rikenellaceae bacterium]